MPPSSRLAHAILLVCVASAALLRTAPADAGSLTAQNTTAVTAYQAGTPTPYFSGPNPYVAQAPIGAEFQTDSLTLQATAGAGGDVLLDLEYLTRFSGSEAVDGVSVTYADIFLGNATASATNGYVYAISLGDETRNGGLEALPPTRCRRRSGDRGRDTSTAAPMVRAPLPCPARPATRPSPRPRY
jgi:hypothetical protein